MLSENYVAIFYSDVKEYPRHNTTDWFRPPVKYPELNDENIGNNYIYSSVRELLYLYKMDAGNYGTLEWNPFGEIIKPGNNVLLKPNMVMDHNQNRKGGTDCLYTQPAVVVPVINYVVKALQGKGKIIIGDAPMQECDFERLIDESGYSEIINYYQEKGIEILLVDFRELTTKKVIGGLVRNQEIHSGAKGTIIDLGNDSEFAQYDENHLDKLRITNYSPDRLREHHTLGKHEYYISDYVLNADVVINLPKPKTHRKAGFTAAMKNMVGINVRKEYLPHHTMGAISDGGDEYKVPSALKKLDGKLYDKKNTHEGKNEFCRAAITMLFAGGIKYVTRKACKDYSEGSWYGNETISKTITDLNKILLYADKAGQMKDNIQRQVLSIGDMIICGEKEGPVSPSPRPLGVLVIGQNSVNFDIVTGTMMGAKIDKIPLLRDIPLNKRYSLRSTLQNNNVRVISNNEYINNMVITDISASDKWNLKATQGWQEVFGK